MDAGDRRAVAVEVFEEAGFGCEVGDRGRWLGVELGVDGHEGGVRGLVVAVPRSPGFVRKQHAGADRVPPAALGVLRAVGAGEDGGDAASWGERDAVEAEAVRVDLGGLEDGGFVGAGDGDDVIVVAEGVKIAV